MTIRKMSSMTLAALLVAVVSMSALIGRPVQADGGAAVITVIAKEGGKFVTKEIKDALNSWRSEHTRYYPDGKVLILPIKDLGGSRMSFNFDHQSWVPRGSKPVQIKLTIHGVPDEIRDRFRLVMKADKQGRKDRDRSKVVKHGSTFELKYGTSGDRAYYFVERGTDLSTLIRQGAYIKLTKVSK